MRLAREFHENNMEMSREEKNQSKTVKRITKKKEKEATQIKDAQIVQPDAGKSEIVVELPDEIKVIIKKLKQDKETLFV